MALVPEDGTLVAGANSFVTRAEIIAYAAARGIVIPDDEGIDADAINAMDYLWTLCYKGDLVPGATTPFPRMGLIDGDTAVGYAYTIPVGMKNAHLQLTLDAHAGIDLAPSAAASPLLKRSKVGPLEREYFEPTQVSAPLSVANAWLSPHLCSDGAFAFTTVRG